MYQFVSITLLIILGMFLNTCGQITSNDEGMDSKSIEEASGTTGDTTTDTTTSDDSTTSDNTTSWITKASLPIPIGSAPGSAVVGSKIYLIAGQSQYTSDNRLQIFDTTNNTWSTGANTNTEKSYVYNSTAIIGNYIYVFSTTNSSSNEYYNATSDNWTSANWSNCDSCSVSNYDNITIYLFGGGSYENETKKIFIDNGTVTSMATMPVKRARSCAVSDGTYIYLLGGINDDGLVTQIDFYNPSDNTWSTKSSNMLIGTSSLGCAISNNKIYVVGIQNDPRNQVYDISSNEWSLFESLPFTGGRIFPAVEIVNKKIYVIAGCCNYNDTIWEYSLN